MMERLPRPSEEVLHEDDRIAFDREFHEDLYTKSLSDAMKDNLSRCLVFLLDLLPTHPVRDQQAQDEDLSGSHLPYTFAD